MRVVDEIAHRVHAREDRSPLRRIQTASYNVPETADRVRRGQAKARELRTRDEIIERIACIEAGYDKITGF